MRRNPKLTTLWRNTLYEAFRTYAWTVIRVEDRSAYLSALDRASIDGDIGSFAQFVVERVVRDGPASEQRWSTGKQLPS
jgi:hypothetical protein